MQKVDIRTLMAQLKYRKQCLIDTTCLNISVCCLVVCKQAAATSTIAIACVCNNDSFVAHPNQVYLACHVARKRAERAPMFTQQAHWSWHCVTRKSVSNNSWTCAPAPGWRKAD